MTDAVIVSTARTGLAKSWRGAFNMTHGATLGGHVTQAAAERARLDPARVVDELEAIAHGRTAALCCFESAHEIGLSRRFCHRHIAACPPKSLSI